VSDDLVKRLREHAEQFGVSHAPNICDAAADRIEKLEAMLETVMRSAGYPDHVIRAALRDKKDD
jgi:hypothetical protein